MHTPFIVTIDNIRVAIRLGEIQDDGQLEIHYTTVDKEISTYTQEERDNIEKGVFACIKELERQLKHKVNNASN